VICSFGYLNSCPNYSTTNIVNVDAEDTVEHAQFNGEPKTLGSVLFDPINVFFVFFRIAHFPSLLLLKTLLVEIPFIETMKTTTSPALNFGVDGIGVK
jgi:hypothetical protein